VVKQWFFCGEKMVNTRGFKCGIVVTWTVERAIAEMQSLFSCLFALLLYAGGRVQDCGLLPASCKGTGGSRTERSEDACY